MIMAKRSLPAAKVAGAARGRPTRATGPGPSSTAPSPPTGTPGRILAKPTARRCSEATSATVTTSPGRLNRISSLESVRKRGSSSAAAVSRIRSATRCESPGLSIVLADDSEQVLFLQDHVLDAVELHFRARPLAVDHLVADLHAERLQAAVFQSLALADGHDLALHGLLLGGVGNDDAGLGLGLGGQRLQQESVVQGLELHDLSSSEMGGL